MTRRDLLNRDASDRAASELEYVIKSKKLTAEAAVPKVTADQAMKGKRVFEHKSDRDVTRVLFISQDNELLNPTQQSLDGYVNISDLFDEVHIVIVRKGIKPKYPVLRVADNVWLYTAAAKYCWQTPREAIKLIEDQLVFAAGFRPDLVVARDPFESALVAYHFAKKFKSPTQLHVLDDFTSEDFINRDPLNKWRAYLPAFTIPRFYSVRTQTSNIQTKLEEKYKIPDLDTLPRYQDYQSIIDKETKLDLKDKYRPLIFFILFIGDLNHKSTLFRAIDAARFVLKNSRVGMIVLGKGKLQKEFENRAKTLGIEKQVIFESRQPDVVSYLKSANMLIVTDTDFDSEEVVLKGAAAGTPMVLAKTEKREDVFTDGESAFLCDVEDIQAFTDRIDDLLNSIELREKFSDRSKKIIRTKFHSDPEGYMRSYRASIEEAFFVGDKDKSEEEA